jgi:hypothetical protein
MSGYREIGIRPDGTLYEIENGVPSDATVTRTLKTERTRNRAEDR